MGLIFFITILVLGYFVGRYLENKHLKQLLIQEREVQHLAWRNTGLKEDFKDCSGTLVYGSVVIAQDAFKNFLAGLINIFGGRITSYESLLERARREAILRARQKAMQLGAKQLVNLRLETSTISINNQNSSGAVEVFCYATALI